MGTEASIGRVKAGDPLRLSARWVNAVSDLLGERSGERPIVAAVGTETAPLVLNDTDEDLEEFSVVRLGDPLFLPTVSESKCKYLQANVGGMPVAGEPFAITQTPLRSGVIGKAIVLGETFCTLNVADEADTHASPADDDTADLATGTSGPARILWKDDGTGPGKRAKVLLLGQGGGGSELDYASATGTVSVFGDPPVIMNLAVGKWLVTGQFLTFTTSGVLATQFRLDLAATVTNGSIVAGPSGSFCVYATYAATGGVTNAASNGGTWIVDVTAGAGHFDIAYSFSSGGVGLSNVVYLTAVKIG